MQLEAPDAKLALKAKCVTYKKVGLGVFEFVKIYVIGTFLSDTITLYTMAPLNRRGCCYYSVHVFQGVRAADHFGFICKELSQESIVYVSYIFRCEKKSVAEEIMQGMCKYYVDYYSH